MKSTIKKPNQATGFSLIEGMIVLAVLTFIVSTALIVVGDLGRGTQRQKLQSDVVAINTAIRNYESNGGNLAGVSDVNEVLAKLKSRSANGIEIAGLRGSFVDPRIGAEMLADGKELRAVWDAKHSRFTLQTKGTGVGRFTLDSKLAEIDYGTEQRTAKLQLARKDTWIWDYTDRSRPEPSVPGGSGAGATVPTPSGSGASVFTLQPPLFSEKGGVYALSKYNLGIFLDNPNLPKISRILYSTVEGQWKEYGGESIPVAPDSSIVAYAESLDHKVATDSTKALEYYGIEPLALQIAFSFQKAAYTFKELGGAMIPGNKDNGFAPAAGTVRIVNGTDVARFLGAGAVQLMGRIEGGAESSLDFLDAYSGVKVLNLSDFGPQSRIIAEARAVSRVATLAHSPVVKVEVAAQATKLLTPSIQERPRPDGLFVYDEHYIEIVLDTASGEIPVGAPIYYTVDGSDPGESNGLPTSPTAKLYEKPFLITQPDGRPIRARVYAPQANSQWFVSSEKTEIVWPLVASISFTMRASTSPPVAPSLTPLLQSASTFLP